MINTCMEITCNIHETKSLSNILYIRQSSLRARCKNVMTCWTTSTRSRPLRINSSCVQICSQRASFRQMGWT